jgi:hypothetical protein
MFLGDPIGGFYTRRACSCGGEIEFDKDKAVCKNCSTVFNDGGNTDGMVISTKVFFDGHHESAPPPRPRRDKTAIHAIMRAVV